MLAGLSQGRSCGQTARGGRASVCRVEFSYLVPAAVTTSPAPDAPPSRRAPGVLPMADGVFSITVYSRPPVGMRMAMQ